MKFLVDVNLPKFFAFFNTDSFRHVVDINPSLGDSDIWEVAMNTGEIIITKDVDFYSRYIVSQRSPKIVYLKLGNMKLNELHKYFTDNWQTILSQLQHNTLIIAYPDRLEFVEK